MCAPAGRCMWTSQEEAGQEGPPGRPSATACARTHDSAMRTLSSSTSPSWPARRGRRGGRGGRNSVTQLMRRGPVQLLQLSRGATAAQEPGRRLAASGAAGPSFAAAAALQVPLQDAWHPSKQRAPVSVRLPLLSLPSPTERHSMYCTWPPTAVQTSPAAVPGEATRSAGVGVLGWWGGWGREVGRRQAGGREACCGCSRERLHAQGRGGGWATSHLAIAGGAMRVPQAQRAQAQLACDTNPTTQRAATHTYPPTHPHHPPELSWPV